MAATVVDWNAFRPDKRYCPTGGRYCSSDASFQTVDLFYFYISVRNCLFQFSIASILVAEDVFRPYDSYYPTKNA